MEILTFFFMQPLCLILFFYDCRRYHLQVLRGPHAVLKYVFSNESSSWTWSCRTCKCTAVTDHAPFGHAGLARHGNPMPFHIDRIWKAFLCYEQCVSVGSQGTGHKGRASGIWKVKLAWCALIWIRQRKKCITWWVWHTCLFKFAFEEKLELQWGQTKGEGAGRQLLLWALREPLETNMRPQYGVLHSYSWINRGLFDNGTDALSWLPPLFALGVDRHDDEPSSLRRSCTLTRVYEEVFPAGCGFPDGGEGCDLSDEPDDENNRCCCPVVSLFITLEDWSAEVTGPRRCLWWGNGSGWGWGAV